MTDYELKQLLSGCPPAGSTWRHRDGGVYTVVGAAVREEDLSPLVLYRSAGGVVWSRLHAEFAERFTLVDGGGGYDA
jgi:hypothetical protein